MGLKIKNSKNIVTDGLILHLDASDKLSYSSGITWKDRSPNGYNGTLVNTSFSSAYGGVIDFDGTNDRVSIASSPLLSSHSNNETSVCAWVRVVNFESSGTIGPIVYLRNSANNNQDYIRLGFNTEAQIEVKLKLQATNPTFTSSSDESDETWMLVCFTYDGFYVKMYKDGNLIYSASSTGTLQDSSSNAQSIIGSDKDADYDQFLNGRVGELYCYNKALTASEIKQMYNATKGRFSV